MNQLCVDIHHRVMEIIKEFIDIQRGIQFDGVIQVLLSRYSLKEWRQFGVGDYRAIPLVHVLFELSRKVIVLTYNIVAYLIRLLIDQSFHL